MSQLQRHKWPSLVWAPGAALLAGLLGARSASATPAVGLTVNDTLIRFDTSTPGTVTVAVPVTGLQANETLVGIDVRPATQQVYAIGSTPSATAGGNSTGRIYIINPTTGAATFVATLAADPADTTAPFSGLVGVEFGLDFNPVPDRIRLVSDADQNLRINPTNGLVTTDGTLAFAPTDANAGDNPAVTAVAYTNSTAGATSTTLYGIDTANDALVIQNPPNNGTLVTVGPLNSGNPNGITGFDIAPGTNEAILVGTSDTQTQSFVVPINLATGQGGAPLVIGGGVQVRGLALLPLSTVQFSSATYTVNESAGTVSIPVFRTGDLSGSFTVDFDTANGTATAPFDFTSTSGTITFAPGERSATITVPITFSSAAEPTETFTVTLSNPVSSDASGTNVVRLGANASATVSITDSSAAGSNGGNATIFALTTGSRLISFASSSPGTITSNVAITGLAAGETLLGIDFRSANGLLYGVSSSNRLYTINTVTGAATPGAALTADPSDTSAPFTGLSGTEFGFDFNPAVDRLRITSDTDQNLRINVDTGLVLTDTNLAFDTDTDGAGPDTADVNAGVNPAVVGSGYTNPDNDPGTGTSLYGVDTATDSLVLQNPPNNGTLNTIGDLGIDTTDLVGFDIAPGNTAFAALAPANSLSSLYVVNLSTGMATLRGQVDFPEAIRGIAVALPGTITLSAATATVAENGTSIAVTVTRTGAGAAAVDFTVAGVTATAGSDFTNVSGRINFAAGEMSRTVTIPIVNDTEAEADETFTVTLSNAENATLGAIASQTVTITNDDAPRVATISNVSVNEGDSGTTQASFVVSISSPSASPVSVNYATADGTAMASTSGASGDYVSTAGTLTFAPGETSKTVMVAVNGDLIAEGTETFVVNLSSPVNTTLGSASGAATGTATIIDDDTSALTISLSSGTLSETGTITGTVTRNTSTSTSLTVNLSSGNVSKATVPASVIIPAGATSATFTISGVDDGQANGPQTVVITASADGTASSQVNVVVLDNGTRPNSVPVAQADSYRTTGRVIQVAAPGVLANDRDAEGTALRAILLQSPMHGALVLNANGSFTYTPSDITAGTDTFVYAANDGQSQSVPVTVTLNYGAARDITPPTVTLEGGTLRYARGLSIVRGSAVDPQVTRNGAVAASGLRNVVLRLQRGDGRYYNGRTYQVAPFDLPAAFIGRVFFSLSGTLPTSLADGRYRVTAIATDNARNRSVAQQIVIIDTVAPRIIISTPAADATNTARITSLNLVSGRVSGAVRVQVAVRRADGFYFNGTSYQSGVFFITAAVTNGTYSVSTGLPSGDNLPAGRYTLDVRAVDEAGNIGAATRALVVASAPAM